jgi:hypothetical protein
MSLQVFVNGLELVNGPIHRLNIRETTGLWDPAALVEPGTVETFEGPFRVRQTTVDYGVREITIVGSLYIASVSYADKLRALDWLQSIYAPRPSRVVVGSLELLVDFGRVQIQADELKRLNGTIRYQITGTAVPATLGSSVSAGTGYVQGLAVDTARVNEAATLATMASGVGTITVLGDAPTPAVITIQNSGPTARTYYLATSSTGRRVPITTDANGVGRIDERSGFYLSPGVNRITAYQAATGTATFTDITVMSLFGTTWRFTGNAAAGNVTRYDLGPALTVNRTGSARYFLGNTNPASGGTNGIVTAGDDEPRIGWAWLNRRNIINNSLNISTGWTSTLGSRTQDGALEPFGYRDNSFSVMTFNDTSSGSVQTNSYLLGALGAVSYVASVYILKDSNTTRRAGFFIQTTGGLAYVMLNTSTGVGIRANNSTGTMTGVTVAVSDEGLWWRLSATWTGEAANTFSLAPAIGPTSGNDASSNTQGSAVFACPQVEIGTTPSPYQATDANGIAIDHPANAAGLVLEGQATNRCLYSEDQSNAAWVKGAGGVTSNNTVAPDGTTTGDRLLFSSPFDASSYQILTGLATSTRYCWSLFVKSTSGTVDVTLKVQGVSGSPAVPDGVDVFTPVTTTVGTNWTRVQIQGLSGSNTSLALLVSAPASIDVWGSQFEIGPTSTSYIVTTSAVATREGDRAGVLNPHNLLTYSEDFSNAAWVKGSRITVTANNETGPDGIKNADTVVLAAGSGSPATLDDLRLAAASGTFQAGKTYTLSCWVKTITGSPTMRMFLNNSGPAANSFVPTTSWQRFVLTYTPTVSTSDGWTIDFNNNTSGFTVAIYGAQVTEGHLPGRYVRTTDTQALQTTAIDPSWSQNGYIEFDARWDVTNVGVNLYFFGDGNNTTSGVIIGTSNQSGTVLRFGIYDGTTPTAQLRNAQIGNSTIYNAGRAKVRFEWTNYTLAGNRFMFLRIYLNNVLQNEVNYAGTSGTSWPAIDVSRLWRPRGNGADSGIWSNLTLGVPALPQGAVPAGI